MAANKSKVSSSYELQSLISREYQSSLRAYWEWRPRTCLERLTTLLSLKPESPEAYCLYRLWIEVLSDLKETKTLRSLLDHFSFFIDSGNGNLEKFSALKGLVHFELDEIEAALLYKKALRNQIEDPYAWELRFVLNRRLAEGRVRSNFKSHRDVLLDYFHLVRYGEAALGYEDEREFRWTADRIENDYPKSPFVRLVAYHKSLDGRKYRDAVRPARSLSQEYPLNLTYAFNLGYVYAKMGQYEKAEEELGRINDLYPNEDLDVLNWLGHSVAQIAMNHRDEGKLKKAVQILHRACELSQQSGIPTSFPTQTLARLNQSFERSKDSSQAKRCFLCLLDANQFHQIRTGSEQQIKIIESPLAEDAEPFDLFFLFGADSNSAGSLWRFCALYEATCLPSYHPINGFSNRLSLVDRPEIAVPINLEDIGASQKRVFAINDQAIQIIAETLEEWMPYENSHALQSLRLAQ